MTASATDELYYDPWHADLNADPYPMFKRFRDEAMNRFPDWEVDLDNAIFSSSSAVRGWDSMPAGV